MILELQEHHCCVKSADPVLKEWRVPLAYDRLSSIRPNYMGFSILSRGRSLN